MEPVEIVTTVVLGLIAAVIAFLLTRLGGAIAELTKQVQDLKEALYKDYVTKDDLKPVMHDVGLLFKKCNELAVNCAVRHGNEG